MPSEYNGSTDQVKKVTLTSSLEQVVWMSAFASPGGKASLEIFTHFVGDGAEFQADLSDASGKKLGTFKDKINGNRFWASVQVPREARDALFAEVKLTKHGLTKKSAPLLLGPFVELTNLKWDKAEARRGDILKLTADVKGAYDGTEAAISIWEHDSDGAHDPISKFSSLIEKGRIEAEWAFEYHEDTDDIPTAKEVEQGYTAPEYFFRVEVSGVTADSPLLQFKDYVEIVLLDGDGRPVPDEKYVVKLPDGQERSGTVDKEGKAIERDIPPGPLEITFPEFGERDQTA